MASHPETKVDCSKVYIKKSTFSNEQTGDFDGAFAAVAIKEGQYEAALFLNWHATLLLTKETVILRAFRVR